MSPSNVPDITISWDSDNQTLTTDPSPYYAGNPGQARTITWGPGSGVDNIEGVTIATKDGASYDGRQPQVGGGSNQWQWTDPMTATDTYEYVVSAAVHEVGIRTLDPQIINLG